MQIFSFDPEVIKPEALESFAHYLHDTAGMDEKDILFIPRGMQYYEDASVETLMSFRNIINEALNKKLSQGIQDAIDNQP